MIGSFHAHTKPPRLLLISGDVPFIVELGEMSVAG
jgi:hypothetical protein